MKVLKETDAEVEGDAEGGYVERARDESDQEPAKRAFHPCFCYQNQPEEVLLLCETLDLFQRTSLLLQMDFFLAEQLNFS